jgi:hypothetical protein
MKYLKMIGLAAVAAMALMASTAGTASATKLYSGGTALGTGSLVSLSLTGSSVLSSNGNTLNTCTGGQFTSEITNAGSSTTTVSGPNTTIDFENCVSTVHTESAGSLEIHHIAGTNDGTVTASGAVIGNTIFGTNCLYQSGTGKHLGVLDGKTGASEHATIHIDITVSEAEPKKFICPDTANWTGHFVVTSPTALHVTAS